MRQPGGVPHHFFRYAANINTGAAKTAAFDNGNTGTMGRGTAGGGDATAAGTEDNEIKVLFHNKVGFLGNSVSIDRLFIQPSNARIELMIYRHPYQY
jgi:hypothetical protein